MVALTDSVPLPWWRTQAYILIPCARLSSVAIQDVSAFCHATAAAGVELDWNVSGETDGGTSCTSMYEPAQALTLPCLSTGIGSTLVASGRTIAEAPSAPFAPQQTQSSKSMENVALEPVPKTNSGMEPGPASRIVSETGAPPSIDSDRVTVVGVPAGSSVTSRNSCQSRTS